MLSCVQLFATPFFRQEYWNGLPCPPPGDLLNPGIKPTSPALQADPLPLSHLRGPLMLMEASYFCLETAVNKAAMDTAITYVLSMDRSTDTHLCWVRTQE